MGNQQPFHKGDQVEWASGQGTAVGTVKKKVTEAQTVEGNQVSASKDEPRYLVENDSTGNVTGHRADALSLSGDSAADNTKGSDAFETGDKVAWETSQGTTTGTVKKKLTEETEIKGYTAQASEEEPQYLVESERTGKTAAHKPESLTAAS